MRLVGYVRVSTEEQARDGYGLGAQEHAIRSWCEAMGHELVAVYSDAGASGKSLVRPELDMACAAIAVPRDVGTHRALGMVEALRCPADGLVVAKLDRLTRSVRDFCELVSRFEDAGKALVSVRDSLDTTSASGRLVANIMVSVAQWERETISERTKLGMAEAKRRGVHVGRPAVPIDPVGAEQARRWHFDERVSLAEISRRLGVTPARVRRLVFG